VDLGLYALDWETVGDSGTARTLDYLLGAHEATLGRAFVDAVSNESPLPDEAAAALEELLRLADAQAVERFPKPSFARRLLPSLADDPLLAVELDLGREGELKTFRDFALFSTAAVVFLRDDDQPEIEIYDSGKSFTFFADGAVLDGLERAGVPRDAIGRVD
jgi:hypothetical protein